MKKRLLVLLCIAFSVGSMGAQGFYMPKKYNYDTVTGIDYRPTSIDSYADSICILDLYYPTDKDNFSTLVWYHGGGLTGGNKEIPQALTDKGFAIVGVGYRLSPRATVEECIDDAAASAAWVVKHIAEYGGDPTRIFVAGHSAGGYLTSMIGLDKQWLAKYDVDPDTSFAALLPYSGQAITHFTRRAELGMTQMQPLVDELSPLYHVRPDCPPMVILSGDRELEMVGRYEENAYFWRMLKLVGHQDVTLYEFDGFNHNTMATPAHLITVDYIRAWERTHNSK